MNEPKRLLAPDGDAATGFERQLLQAVLDERPSEAATQRMLEATLAAGTATVPGAVGMGAGAWLASTAVAVGIAGLAAAVWLGGDGAALDDAAHTRSGTSPVSAANEASNDDAARGGKGSPRPSIDTERNAVTPPTPSLKAGALEAGALESAATAETRTGDHGWTHATSARGLSGARRLAGTRRIGRTRGSARGLGEPHAARRGRAPRPGSQRSAGGRRERHLRGAGAL